jgi:lipoprotein-releasing system permease protein
MAAYELFVARRYLGSRRKPGFISLVTYMAVGGVVLGVAALVIVLSVTNGFSGEVENRLVGMNAHVLVRRLDGDPITDWRALQQQLASHPGVVATAPVIDSKVVIASKPDLRMDGIVLWGVDPTHFGQVSDLPRHLAGAAGGGIALGTQPGQRYPGIILGQQLANRLRVGPGSEVLLVTLRNMDLQGAMADMAFSPRTWTFLVTDTFESGMYQYDDNIAFVGLADAQRVLGLGDGVSDLHLRVDGIYRAAAIRAELETELGFPYSVRDWSQLFPEFFHWIDLEKKAIFLALSLIILVASFNIMSILSMSVTIKTAEIGILRAMGSTSASVARIFTLQGLAIGVGGTIVGCLVGLAVCLAQQHFHLISIPGEVYLINSLPVDMRLLDFVLVSSVSLAICLVTSIYPSRRAAALLPVDAIRYIS